MARVWDTEKGEQELLLRHSNCILSKTHWVTSWETKRESERQQLHNNSCTSQANYFREQHHFKFAVQVFLIGFVSSVLLKNIISSMKSSKVLSALVSGRSPHRVHKTVPVHVTFWGDSTWVLFLWSWSNTSLFFSRSSWRTKTSLVILIFRTPHEVVLAKKKISANILDLTQLDDTVLKINCSSSK